MNLPAWCFETRRCEGHDEHYCATVMYKVNFHYLDGKMLCASCCETEIKKERSKNVD